MLKHRHSLRLQRGLCRAGESTVGIGAVGHEAERTGRVHGQKEVREERGGGKMSRLSEHRIGERVRERDSKIAVSKAGGWQRSSSSSFLI